ncbi:MAG: TetR/AcrR family transcriptional regulator [Herpetosiphonaceae bacterium]|nr:TetR/AcrR family transcriptional regulator [Herpetosiphonaceae bacterium]
MTKSHFLPASAIDTDEMPKLPADGRRHELARATVSMIAERGLEGLRTRDVAARVGLNIATLHYYFATKADLIAGAVEYIVEQSRHVHAPLVYAGTGTALDHLHQEFADARFYQTAHTELWMASHELSLRAFHDPAIARMITTKDAYWHNSVAEILADGVREGIFRADLNAHTATDILLSFFRGVGLVALDTDAFNQACAEIERWLLAASRTNHAPYVSTSMEKAGNPL